MWGSRALRANVYSRPENTLLVTSHIWRGEELRPASVAWGRMRTRTGATYKHLKIRPFRTLG